MRQLLNYRGTGSYLSVSKEIQPSIFLASSFRDIEIKTEASRMIFRSQKELLIDEFWTLVNHLTGDRPTIKSLESLFGVAFWRFSRNKYFEFYKNQQPFDVGTWISHVELQLRRGDTSASTISILLAGALIEIEDINKRFAPLSVMPPSGDSPSQLVYYTSQQHMVSVSFGFPQEPPEFLVEVVIGFESNDT
jgi:hypothetical protein